MAERTCKSCRGHLNFADMEFVHEPNCLSLVETLIPDEPAPPPVASISTARFERAAHPEEITPRDALVAALDWLDDCAPDEKPTHLMVLIGKDMVGKLTASGTKFFQAGTYRPHAQMGLCLEAMHRIRESGRA